SRTAVTNIPNALVQAQLGVEYRRQFIQFDAGSNRGSSGGGLFNMHGEQMGVIAAKVMTEENINYAIPMGTFRRKAEEMIAAEIREGIYTGIRCNLNLSEAIVKEVDPDSPAGRAGVLPGDRIQKVNHFLVTDSIHWPLSLMFRKPGEDIELEYLREGKMAKAKFQLAEYPRTPADEILSDKLEKGLVMSVYEGERQTLPDFATLTPTKQLTVDRWENPEQQAGLERLFQLVYEGYLEIPHDKAIQFVLGSDDGSRLILDGKMVIENDGHHPYQEESCWMRLEPGFHSIRLEYLEWHGDASLSLKWNASGEEPVEIPGQSLFRLKKAGSPDVTKPEEKEPETSDTNQNAS
ncbi:MAG: PDZ domain-containing protein, partial [Planctomycetaceae bacterium]|nr:PDZ domain-containing protein [Planctomycetaceae bacterium]